MPTQTTIQTDDTIRKNIFDQLAWDARVDPANIEVQVNNGNVRLSGWVPSYAARQFAEVDASYIPGVVSVENELAVKYPASAQMPDDKRIEENIKSLIGFNAGINERKISVAVVLGNVILDGTVTTFWQKIRVEALASEVNGVITITNRLSVVPTRNVMDEVIAQNITAALSRNLGIEIDLINVTVDKGVVILAGSVADRIARRAVEEIAERTDGVCEVLNNLVIERSPQD
jgi:osmotically-inducible protein OsmY